MSYPLPGLAILRKQAGLTQAQAARLTWDCVSNYRRLEYGTRFDDDALVTLRDAISQRLGRPVRLEEFVSTPVEVDAR